LTEVVRILRRLLSLALVAALTLMNVQAAELHVHALHLDDAHNHGPAAHHHDDVDHHSADATEIARVDEDDTIIHVALVAATPHSAKPIHAEHVTAPSLNPADSLIVKCARIVARAHGPPSFVQPSLRAPPALLSL
jgi:hypothetical protein